MPAINETVTLDAMQVDSPLPALTKRELVNRLAEFLPHHLVDTVRALVIIGPAVDGTTVFPQELLVGMLKSKPTGLRSASRLAMTRLYQRLGVGLPSGAWKDIAAGRMPAPKQVPSRYDCSGLPLHVMDELLAVAIAMSGARPQNQSNSGQTNASHMSSIIHKYLCVAPADIAPAAQEKGMRAHPKLATYLGVVAAGKREALRFHVPSNKDLVDTLDVASANGQLEMLTWLIHTHFPATFLARPPVQGNNGEPGKFSLQFSKEALLGAARNGHTHVLEFWTVLFASQGVQVGAEVVPVRRASWPRTIFAEAVTGSSLESLEWLLEHQTQHSRSAAMVKDGLLCAAEVGNVVMLARLIAWLQGSSVPAKMRNTINDEKVVNVALASGQLATLEYLSSSGILSTLCSKASVRAKICADLNHLARGKHFAAMDWCVGAGRDHGITVAVSEAGILQASRDKNMDALRWWGENLDRLGIVFSDKCHASFRSAVHDKDTPVVDWWLGQMKAGVLDSASVIDSCAFGVCQDGRVSSLGWLLGRTKAAGVAFECSHRTMDAACVWGSARALQWLLDALRSGDIQVLRYSAAAIAQASMCGNAEVLRWFSTRHVPFMADPDLALPAPHKASRLNSPRSLGAVAEFWAEHRGALAANINNSTVFELTCAQWEAARADYKARLASTQRQAIQEAQPVPMSIVACPLFTASTTQGPDSVIGHLLQDMSVSGQQEKQSIRDIMDGVAPSPA